MMSNANKEAYLRVIKGDGIDLHVIQTVPVAVRRANKLIMDAVQNTIQSPRRNTLSAPLMVYASNVASLATSPEIAQRTMLSPPVVGEFIPRWVRFE